MARPSEATSRAYNLDEMLAFIVAFKRANDGISPTIREIQEACRVSSTSVVKWLLEKLEGQGKVRFRDGLVSRGIMVVGGSWDLPSPGDEKTLWPGRRGRKLHKDGKVVWEPEGEFSGKEFSTVELRFMVKNGVLAAGSIYEIEGKRFVVEE